MALVVSLLLSLLLPASSFSLGAAASPRVRISSPVMGMDFVELRKVLTPADNKDSLRNSLGLQPLCWGAYTLAAPAQSAQLLFGVATCGWSLTLTRALAMLHVLVGAQICRSDDTSAMSASVVLFGGWALLLKGAIGAGTVGVAAWQPTLWCALCALFAAARLGITASGAVFCGSWAALLLGPVLFVKMLALPLIPRVFQKEAGGTAAAAAPKPKPAAKPKPKPSSAKSTPAPPAAPPGYRYDAWGRLVVA
jgi:hypothetical protein